MPIALVRSGSEAPSYPFFQKTFSARSSALSASNARGRPLGTANLLSQPPSPAGLTAGRPQFHTCRYIIPLDPASPPVLSLPAGTQLKERMDSHGTEAFGKSRGGHGR